MSSNAGSLRSIEGVFGFHRLSRHPVYARLSIQKLGQNVSRPGRLDLAEAGRDGVAEAGRWAEVSVSGCEDLADVGRVALADAGREDLADVGREDLADVGREDLADVGRVEEDGEHACPANAGSSSPVSCAMVDDRSPPHCCR
eukprot:TRINITY_DN1965_c0_g1_i1.p3 TRINITY_DN1965_c0_g1~~TRINITY_DN1965_c0_g1_i1.p3  ORF type:complete len:143 (-),score=25.89 TRINITY_DN1965_c0_g1_i1:253-681(-)